MTKQPKQEFEIKQLKTCWGDTAYFIYTEQEQHSEDCYSLANALTKLGTTDKTLLDVVDYISDTTEFELVSLRTTAGGDDLLLVYTYKNSQENYRITKKDTVIRLFKPSNSDNGDIINSLDGYYYYFAGVEPMSEYDWFENTFTVRILNNELGVEQ